MSRSTIHRRMLQWNLQVSQRFSAMSDLELDRLIVEVKRDFPMQNIEWCRANCVVEGTAFRDKG